jgi:hypothetical protein
MSTSIARFVTPFKYRREQEEAAKVRLIRQRDGDDCRRCRRPIRFDLPAGHDHGAFVQPIEYGADVTATSFDNLCLTHRRCNAANADNTAEVTERIRRKQEAELFAKSRKRVRRSA